MRISDTQFSQLMLNSLASNNARLGEVMSQMSSGERLQKLSDDPIDAIKLLNLDRESSAINQYQENIKSLKTSLSNQEVHLDTASEVLMSVRDTLLRSKNADLSDQDRRSFISVLESSRDSLKAIFNARNEEGHYIFSGTKTDAPAVSMTGTQHTVIDSADKRRVSINKSVTMEANVTANEILKQNGSNILNQIDLAVDQLNNKTANFDAVISASIEMVDNTHNSVLENITTIGGRINNLDLMESSHADNKLFVDKVTNDIEALDYAEASVRLNSYMSALQATQASYVKINQLSLFESL